MIEMLKKMFAGSSVSSKAKAKSRLHFVLVQDRTGLTGDQMAKFKEELVSVIGKYFVIDRGAFDIEYKRDSESTTLLINSPIVIRRQESGSHSAGSKRDELKAEKDQEPQVAPAV